MRPRKVTVTGSECCAKCLVPIGAGGGCSYQCVWDFDDSGDRPIAIKIYTLEDVRVIHKVGGKHVVVSRKTGKRLSKPASKAEAIRELRQI